MDWRSRVPGTLTHPGHLPRWSWLGWSHSEGCASWGWVAQRIVRVIRHQQPQRYWDHRYHQQVVVAQAVAVVEVASWSCRRCSTPRWTQRFKWCHLPRWRPAMTATRRDLETTPRRSRMCPSTSCQHFAKSLPQGRSHLLTLASLVPLGLEGFVGRPSSVTIWMRRQANGPRRSFRVRVTSILGTRIGSASGPVCCCWRRDRPNTWMPTASSSGAKWRSLVRKPGGWYVGRIAGWGVSILNAFVVRCEPILSMAIPKPHLGVHVSQPQSKTRTFGWKSSERLQRCGWPETRGIREVVSSGHRGDDSPEGGAPHKKKKAKKHTGEDKSSVGEDGTYTLNRKGIEICVAYNNNKCGSAAAQGKCKHKRSHQCNKCLGPHQAIKCPGKGKRFNWPTIGGVSGGGSPAAGGASRTEETPQDKRPSSPSGPPTKKQRTDIEKSRDHTIVSSEDEGRGQGFRASGTASGSSKLSSGTREKESQEAINKRKIDMTAAVKVKPKPDKRPEPLAKARGSVARELEKRVERPGRPKEKNQPEGLYPVLDRPPRGYGYWSGSGRDDRPRALILFSGRARPGDLHQSLVRLG